MSEQPPIPIPVQQRWRDIRLRWVPPVVFASALGLVLFLWNDYVAAPSLVGQAEAVQVSVSSPKAGMLAQLNVNRFQIVRAGETVGQVLVVDPRILAASLAVIQAEIESLRANGIPVAFQQRTSMNYDHLVMAWMQDRSRLAMAKVNLQLATAEFQRMSDLYKDKIISQRAFEQAQAARERLQKEVDELTILVADQMRNTQNLQPTNANDITSVSMEPLRTAIAVQESKLRQTEAELSPVTLKAPVDGMVDVIFHRSGEAVTVGEPIVSLAVVNPVRIVGYLQQPILLEPKLGMKVMVRTRGPKRELGDARIVEIGAQMETISSALLPSVKMSASVLGLPIAVSVPSKLRIRSGELLDLTLVP